MEGSRSHPRARTVAIVGRSGAGKTTLLEALAVAGGSLERAGKVDDGSALGGREPEERLHQTSLGLTMAPVWVGPDKLTLIDSPGIVDFAGDLERALDVADVALLVVSATHGVSSDTEVIWERCRAAMVPVVVVVSQLDAERADFESTLAALEELVGPTLAPLELPLGSGDALRGVVDLLADEALLYEKGEARYAPVPDEVADLERRVRGSLLEAIVVGDDSLTERYLEGEAPSIDELEEVLGHLMVEGRIYPLVCASSLAGIGVDRLITLLDEIAESRPIAMLEGGHRVEIARDPDAQPILRAFKVIIDNYVGRMVVMEVVAGTVAGEAPLMNTRTHSEERLHGLGYLVGPKVHPLERAVTGDVVVARLSEAQAGDVLCARGRDLAPVVDHPYTPALSVAVTSSDKDAEKVVSALHRLAEEDPSLRVRFEARTRSLILDLMGEMHLQVTLERLRRRFHLDVATAPPPVVYFETITKASDVEGKLKKQTGGHGQYAVVNVRFEPLDPGEGFAFVDEVVGGSVPRQYIGAVRNGIERAMAQGGPNGMPVVGLRATLYDGKSHSVDSSEAAFETAGSLALRSALESTGTIVLERIMQVEAHVPADALGDVLTDLTGRRGKVMGTDQDESGVTIVTAHVPESELARYGLDLRGLTNGRGRVTILPHHLGEAPKGALKG